MRELTFMQWKEQIDSELLSICGLTSECLPDTCYRDNYDGGMSAKEQALELLEEEGYPFDNE